MSFSTDFDDTAKICAFYSGEGFPLVVDEENRYITVGDYIVVPVLEDGHLTAYIVVDPEHITHLVSDLDSFFQGVLPDWSVEL